MWAGLLYITFTVLTIKALKHVWSLQSYVSQPASVLSMCEDTGRNYAIKKMDNWFLYIQLILNTLSHLKLQRQGEALCLTMEAPGSLSQAVEGRHLILGAQACSGHQGAPTQEYMVATSTKTGTWLSSGKCRNNERFYSARHAVQ